MPAARAPVSLAALGKVQGSTPVFLDRREKGEQGRNIVDKQLKFIRRLVGIYFRQYDRAWQTGMAIRMQREMDGYSEGEQVEYLLNWLHDRRIAVDVAKQQISLVEAT